MTYRLNALGSVMSSMDGRIWTKLPPKHEQRILRQWSRFTVRCAHGPHDGMKRRRECVSGAKLDLETLMWTRGRNFPISRLESRMKCPSCGSRQVTIMFDIPPNNQLMRASS